MVNMCLINHQTVTVKNPYKTRGSPQTHCQAREFKTEQRLSLDARRDAQRRASGGGLSVGRPCAMATDLHEAVSRSGTERNLRGRCD